MYILGVATNNADFYICHLAPKGLQYSQSAHHVWTHESGIVI